MLAAVNAFSSTLASPSSQLSKYALGFLGSLSLIIISTPTQAGFFEVLFGQPTNSYFYGSQQPIPPTPEEELERQKQSRLAMERQMSEQAARNLKISRVLADISQDSGRKQAFLMDPTLRYGDIVVTDTGLEVFEGKSWKDRSPLQFRPLHLSTYRNRKDLQLMQKASGFQSAPENLETASNMRTITISAQQKTKTVQQNISPPQARNEIKPRLEAVRPPQSMNVQTAINAPANNSVSATTTAQTRKPIAQQKKIRPEAESPVAANVFFLFR
jgi:hypothetical protein